MHRRGVSSSGSAVLALVVGLAAFGGLAVGGLAGGQTRWFERAVLYWPAPMARHIEDLRCGETPIEQLRIKTADGVDLSAWWLPPRAPTEPVVLYLHGNGANLLTRGPWICRLRTLPAGVLAIDWRGYGSSGGVPSEDGLLEDARAAWRFLQKQRGIAADRIVIYGKSLGGGPASALAAETTPRLLVLQSTFTSLPALARKLFGRPVAALTVSRFDVLGALAAVQAPVLILHGTRDALVPPAMAAQLATAAADARLVLLPAADHNNLTALYPQRVLDEWRRRLVETAATQK